MPRSEAAATPMEHDVTYVLGNEETAFTKGHGDIPFSKERIAFLDAVSANLRHDPESRLYPDIRAYAFWIRRASMQENRDRFVSDDILRTGRGTVFHIAPSNVPVIYAYTFAASFICGCKSIVRLPSKHFPQEDVINRAVTKALDSFPAFRKDICFLRYPRVKEINDRLSLNCDVRVIWGGDATIDAIRLSPLPPRATEVTFADRYSIAVIDTDTLAGYEDLSDIAADFYNDTYLTDQNACTSPRLICFTGSSSDLSHEKELFFKAVHDAALARYTLQDVSAVDKLTTLMLASAAIEGLTLIPGPDNLLVRVRADRLSDRLMDYRGNCGMFYEYDFDDITELLPVAGSRLQTISYIGDPAMFTDLLNKNPDGIDRIVPVGHTMDFDLVWDGYRLTDCFTRQVSVR